ncbi:MAG: class I tRNA ligase family protein, partial [Bacteroidales bacterium]|nr:class I tRNA ligase family protein [Bacteroidales bacterium]
IFSRQRYWGEPFPVYYKNSVPTMVPEECLPIELPQVADFKPTKTGEPPLGNAQIWAWDEANNTIVDKALVDEVNVFPLELFTMPGFAGSSAYYLRYMDPNNSEALISEEAGEYWKSVDLYVGGSEHATGHLIYSRFWNKFLFDLGISKTEEPFQKLLNQGMIQGWSSFAYRRPTPTLPTREGEITHEGPVFVSANLLDKYPDCQPIHADISMVEGKVLDVEAFRNWRPEFAEAAFILDDETISLPHREGQGGSGQYVVNQAIEKMSKSKYNVVNPDDICEKYGADTLRLYEMFLGPIEQSKPWDVAGIDGCFRFLKKAWNLFWTRDGQLAATDDAPSKESLKTLHKLIKKVTEDIEVFSYNTSIPAFMVAAGELAQQKCTSREVLEQFIVLLAPFAPHFSEELWHQMGHTTTVCDAQWPTFNEEYLKEDSVTLGVQFNGKVRFSMQFAADATPQQMQEQVLGSDEAKKYIDGMQIVKVVAVPKRIVNVVVKPQK